MRVCKREMRVPAGISQCHCEQACESKAMKRICLWSGPRNVSTALMYSFAQRADTRVVDEPLYAAYLSGAGAHRAQAHPTTKHILASQPQDLEWAVGQGMLGECDRSVLFIKNMAQHWRGLDAALLPRFANVLLFRHPALVARSFDKIVASPSPDDLAYPMQLEIANEMEARGLPVIGLESARVRNDPERELRLLCERLDLPFDDGMLNWEAGPRPEDGIWAPYWYANVHASTGFSPDLSEPPAVDDLAPHLQDVVRQCLPMYERLLTYCAANT
jgi:hypothetical protein